MKNKKKILYTILLNSSLVSFAFSISCKQPENKVDNLEFSNLTSILKENQVIIKFTTQNSEIKFNQGIIHLKEIETNNLIQLNIKTHNKIDEYILLIDNVNIKENQTYELEKIELFNNENKNKIIILAKNGTTTTFNTKKETKTEEPIQEPGSQPEPKPNPSPGVNTQTNPQVDKPTDQKEPAPSDDPSINNLTTEESEYNYVVKTLLHNVDDNTINVEFGKPINSNNDLEFTLFVLESDNVLEYKINKNKNIEFNNISFNLNTLKENSLYEVFKLSVNGQDLPIQSLIINTKQEETNKPSLLTLDYELNTSEVHKNIKLSFNTEVNHFLPNSVYEGVLVLNDKETSEKTYVLFNYQKSTTPNLNNIVIPLTDEYDSEDSALDNPQVEILLNKQFEVDSIHFREQGANDFLDFALNKSNNVSLILNTTDSSVKYSNFMFSVNGQNIEGSFNLIGELQNPEVIINNDLGGEFKLNVTKETNGSYKFVIENANLNTSYYLHKIISNEQRIYPESNIDKTKLILKNTRPEFDKEILNIDNESINNGFSQLITLNYFELLKYNIQPTTLELEVSQNQEIIYLKHKEINQENKTITFVWDNEKLLNSFNINKIISYSQSFEIEKNINTGLTSNTVTIQNETLNNLLTEQNFININKWWIKSYKEEFQKNPLVFLFKNLKTANNNRFKLNNFDFNFDNLEIEKNSISYTTIDNNSLRINFKFKSNENLSKEYSIIVNNFWQESDFSIKNPNNIDLTNIITLTNTGRSAIINQINQEFQEFKDTDDLDASLGAKTLYKIPFNNSKLSQYFNIDNSLKLYDTTNHELYLVLYGQTEGSPSNQKTTPFNALNMIQYKILAKFNKSASNESIYKNAILNNWISGFTLENNLYKEFIKSMPDTFKNLEIFNRYFGFKDKNTNLQELVQTINQTNDFKEKTRLLLEKTNLSNFFNQVLEITKNKYNPPITNQSQLIKLNNVSIDMQGQNQILVADFEIIPLTSQIIDNRLTIKPNNNFVSDQFTIRLIK
ncbi:hypothetical protein RRG38_00215 [Mycoplasmopsis felis]|uniref:hypothetical protein n=1 Tax=Mycoplasmopsis felis TaxID=33923 RepID=UPI002AF6C391|nr:hypothetical protein [Mycoplasmopsis felis]WQQ02220.1 hypothetical protein RNN91_02690 [Mycoplasmopsis felis]